jgi:hypothetical protein
MKQAEEHESNGFRTFGRKDFYCSVKFKGRAKQIISYCYISWTNSCSEAAVRSWTSGQQHQTSIMSAQSQKVIAAAK